MGLFVLPGEEEALLPCLNHKFSAAQVAIGLAYDNKACTYSQV